MFLNPLFLSNITCGLLFVIAGFILKRYPTKHINALYGYRTKTSMKNQNIWDYAQIYASKQMIKAGAILIFLSLLGTIYTPKIEIALLLSIVILIAVVIFMVYRVEKKYCSFNLYGFRR